MLILSCLFLSIGFIVAQTTRATGTVVDDAGEPVVSASVVVKGTTVGVVTDLDGKFSINVPDGNNTLVFTLVGMKTLEVRASSNMNVVMVSDEKVLDDVVVIGYGVVKKSELTGAISSVNSDKFSDIPVSSIAQALQGKVSGLQIVNTSGRSGNETQISLRGNGSLNASTNVLYIIDGIPTTTISGISTSDIDNVSVLKDAASTAIYGSRASNGVIIITTKTGKLNSKNITFNSTIGWQSVVKKPKLLNVGDYTKVMNTAISNYQADIDAGIQKAPSNPNYMTQFVPVSNEGTNWLDEVMNDNALTQNYELGVSIGERQTRLYLGAAFYKQESAIKMDEFQRSTVKLNASHQLYSNFTFGVNSSFALTKSVPLLQDNNIYQPWNAAMKARPDQSIYDDEGKLNKNYLTNPLTNFGRDVESNTLRLTGNAYFDLDIIDGLRWHSSAGGYISNYRLNRYDPANTRMGEDSQANPVGYGRYETKYDRSYIIENTLTYSNSIFDKLNYTFLLGHSYQTESEEESFIQGEDFSSSELKWLDSAGKKTDGGSNFTENALDSYFSRLQLNWDNRYNMMLSLRRDGSSKFSKDNHWGNFFAVSGAWTLSNEQFFKSNFIDLLRVRASFGQTGNQDGIGNASGQNLLSSGSDYNYNGAPGLAPARLYNPDLTWERTEAFDVGVDFNTWNNRVIVTLDYFSKLTKDLLYSIPVPHETGFRVMQANSGQISNKGFEIEAGVDIIRKTDMNWNVSANFTYVKNKVKTLEDPFKKYYTTQFVSIIEEGQPLGSFSLIKALGVAQEVTELKDKDGVVRTTIQPGDMLYEDLNGDGIINEKDNQTFNGGLAPMYGGFSTTFQYKGFDLGINAQYSIGKKMYALWLEGTKGQLNGGAVGYPSYSVNMLSEIKKAWTPDNKNTDVPRLNAGSTTSNWNTRRSSRFLYDADYLRISDITLGFDLCKLNLDALKKINQARVFIQMRNPITITNYIGTDPEGQYVDPDRENNKVTAGVDQGGIPNMKAFLIGLNLSF